MMADTTQAKCDHTTAVLLRSTLVGKKVGKKGQKGEGPWANVCDAVQVETPKTTPNKVCLPLIHQTTLLEFHSLIRCFAAAEVDGVYEVDATYSSECHSARNRMTFHLTASFWELGPCGYVWISRHILTHPYKTANYG
jgi:hypothetical protein